MKYLATDTIYCEMDVHDYYISYQLQGSTLHRDTVSEASVTGPTLLKALAETDREPVYDDDSMLIGWQGCGTRIFCDKDLSFVFIRTKYLYADFTIKDFSEPEVVGYLQYEVPRNVRYLGKRK